MVKKLSENFIKGVGSTMNIFPRKSYPIKSYVPGQTTADRLRGDWVKVGQAMSKVISSQKNGQR